MTAETLAIFTARDLNAALGVYLDSKEDAAVEQALKEYEDDRPWDETVYTGAPNPSGITIICDCSRCKRLRMPTKPGTVPDSGRGANRNDD